MGVKNFLQRLIKNLSHDVFRPAPNGILYLTLQTIEREIGGECPWDTSESCQKGYDSYWTPQCRNINCPGYRHPLGLIAYTSRSADSSSVDNRFDYSSIRYRTGIEDDWIPVGTLGAQTKFDFGLWADSGGYGAWFYGQGFYGSNAINPTGKDIYIGDKWYVTCHTSSTVVGTDAKNYQCKLTHLASALTKPITGANWSDYWEQRGISGEQWVNGKVYTTNSIVSPAIPDPGNRGIYGAVDSRGPYTGDHDTIYTIEIIDFWGYVQNFNDALLQISLATCTGTWLDYWGDYFGIPRLLEKTPSGSIKGYEDDTSYRARIMKEITRAKGTRAVLYEEARDFFKSELVSVEEYHQQGARSVVLGTDRNYYECIQDHTAITSRRPITGVDWSSYWRQGGLAGNTWMEGANYIVGTYPRWDGPVPNISTDPAKGLWPFQFYINIPTQKSPSAKFVKNADVNFCTCESGYGYSPCRCDLTEYSPVVSCACDASCYGYNDCSCDSACYGYEHLCDCDVACYGYSACSCNSTCYAQGCGCNATCYVVASSYCGCFWTCYGQTCGCNATCYTHSVCSCDASCYGEGHSCACNNARYGYHSCACDSACYGFACSCNSSCYGYACTCDTVCYVYSSGDCKNDSWWCTCESGYGYVPCSCDSTCYIDTCTCDYTNYGESPCTCEYTCYGEQSGTCTCNSTCYGYSPCTCNLMCYNEGGCTCDAACYGYSPCQCDVTCYGYAPGVPFKLEGIFPSATGMGWTYEAGTGYYYGYGAFVPILSGTKVFSDPVNIGDSILIGHQYQFSGAYFKWVTPGVDGAYIWEYWNGAGWTTLTFRDQNIAPVPGEENVNRLRQDGWVHWLEGLTGWQRADNIPYNIPDTGTELYWVRCRVTSNPSVIPVVDELWITYAGATCRGHFIAHGIDTCICDAMNYGGRDCTCDSACYLDAPCQCDVVCYAYSSCTCDSSNYGYSACSCDSACYGYVPCSCDASCYAQTCGCNGTCYIVGSSYCGCFWTCYSQGCSCNYSNYGYVACSCNLSCYQFAPCSCDSACYGYHGCDCNATCYAYHMCECESTCYGDYVCVCDYSCYGEALANYNPATRDKNNCYIYFEGSFAKPVYETGLQEIIDRLKTAGTIAIINPLD